MTDLPNDRDPRINPKTGDVLSTAFRTRTVQKVMPDRWSKGMDVYFTTPHGQREDICTIESWRRWAKRAAVEKRGDATP